MGNRQEEEEIEALLKPQLPTKIKKEVKVIENGSQYILKLPISFVEELNIKKGDSFIIELDPETKEYSIKLKEKK